MKDEKGFSLIEILVALVILSITAVGMFSSLIMATKVSMNTNTEETARDLAVAEMEFIKHSAYQTTSYNIDPSLDLAGHSMTVNVVPITGDEQKVIVSVSYKVQRAVESVSRQFVLENYKVDR